MIFQNVGNYSYLQYNISVDLNLQLNRCDNLTSRILNFALGAYLLFVCAHCSLQLLY
jgi:hypothetical protein